MEIKKKILIAVFIALLLSFGMVCFLGAGDPVLGVPISYEGYVYLDVGTTFTGGVLEMYARRGGKSVPGLTVKLEDRTATYRSNTYSCQYEGLRPGAGSTVTVSIQMDSLIPRLRPVILRVTGTVPAWLAITSPRTGATIAAAGARTLDVAWSGDNPPYMLLVREEGTRRLLLKAEGIIGTSYSVPMGVFTPGTKCKLHLFGKEHKMLFSEPVSAASTFKLTQYHGIAIAIE